MAQYRKVIHLRFWNWVTRKQELQEPPPSPWLVTAGGEGRWDQFVLRQKEKLSHISYTNAA